MENENQEKTSCSKPARDEKGRLLPGNTANPNGRPIGALSIVEGIRRKLKECPEGDKKTYLEYVIDKVFKKILIDESERVLIDLIDRIDGKALQKVDYTKVEPDDLIPLADKLKSKDGEQRKQIIKYLDEIDKEWDKENEIHNEPTDNDTGTDLPVEQQNEGLETGETS